MSVLSKTVDRLLFHWPSAIRSRSNHRKAKKSYYEYMKQKLGHFMIEVDPGPVGDKDIVLKTAVLREQDVPRMTNPDFYFASGYHIMLSWMKALDRYSFNLRTAKSIMEFGCGSARLIRHLRCIDGIRLIGTDVNADNIAWCKKNIPGIEFYNNELLPPLTFAEDNSLDLIFALSVFTHIPLETQHLWIKELHRILRPGGFLLADVLGPNHQNKMLNTDDLARLRKDGSLTLDAEDPKASLSTQVIKSWDVFQTRGEILKAFGSTFHIHDFKPGFLDLLVLQKLPMRSLDSGISQSRDT